MKLGPSDIKRLSGSGNAEVGVKFWFPYVCVRSGPMQEGRGRFQAFSHYPEVCQVRRTIACCQVTGAFLGRSMSIDECASTTSVDTVKALFFNHQQQF